MSICSDDEFRDVLGRFATGVTIVTSATEGLLHGMTANAFSSLSLEPLQVLVCIDRSAGMHDLLRTTTGFAATVLSDVQQDVSAWFASARRPHGQDQFDRVDWSPGPVTGHPVIQGGLAYVEATVADVFASGDHSIFVGNVVGLGALAGGTPLVWYRGGYHHLGSAVELSAGQSVPNRRSP